MATLSARQNLPLLVAGGAAVIAMAIGAAGLVGTSRNSGAMSYVLILVGLPILYASAQGLVRQARKHALPSPRSVEGGWYEIRPKDSRRDRALIGSALALMWNGFAIPVALHYLLAGSVRRSTVGTLGVVILLGVALSAGAVAAYHLVSLLRLEDARLLIPGRRVFLGKELTVKLIQKSTADLHVSKVRIGLTCMPVSPPATGPANAKLKPVLESWKEAAMDRDVKKGERVRVEHKLYFPPHAPPSIPSSSKAPTHDWSVWLVTQMTQGTNYQAEFPLNVELPPRED